MDASKVIDAIGGTGKTAGLCGLTPSAVSQWRQGGIPRPWELFLRQVRPDAFEPKQEVVSASEGKSA